MQSILDFFGALRLKIDALLVAGAGHHHVVDLLDDLGVRERGDVAERAAASHIAQQPPHDLARTRLREVGR